VRFSQGQRPRTGYNTGDDVGLVALRRVRVEGRLALMREFLAVIQI
jgi:hypothetical protein